MEPLKPAFWYVFPAPLVLGALILLVAHGNDAGAPIGYTLLASVGCAIASAVLLANALTRHVGGRVALALFGFVLLQAFYTFALVAGCSATGQWNMK